MLQDGYGQLSLAVDSSAAAEPRDCLWLGKQRPKPVEWGAVKH